MADDQKRKEVAWSSKSPLVVCWAFLRPTLPVAMESWLKIFSGVNCVITICTWPWRRSICTLIRIRGCVIISNHCLLLYLPLHQPCWSRWLDRRLGSMQMVSWSWKAHDLSTPPTIVASNHFNITSHTFVASLPSKNNNNTVKSSFLKAPMFHQKKV